jgi:hypothetical protein
MRVEKLNAIFAELREFSSFKNSIPDSWERASYMRDSDVFAALEEEAKRLREVKDFFLHEKNRLGEPTKSELGVLKTLTKWGF